MKAKNYLSLLVMIALGISGCIPAVSTALPTQTEADTSTPSPTFFSLTSTSTFNPTETVTATPPATLEPEQAKETIRTLLQEPVDCKAPCFWGIMPGQTTFEEAINIFTHLGLQLEHTNTRDNKEFYGVIYHLGNGLAVTPVLTVQNNIVENLWIGINDTSAKGSSRKWSMYSPETLIQRYGSPSRVEFSLGRVTNPSHTMILYFENVKMIILYLGKEKGFLKNKSTLELCPLTNQVEYMRIWMGDDPQHPPLPDVSLEKATSLTIEDFSKLMMGDPAKACFNLKNEAFP